MILLQDIILVIRNARDKVQVARFKLSQEANTYYINRFTGQFQGKFTEQPEKIIEKGKAKRTALQQAELEFNSLLKKSMDKGYKKLSDLTRTKFDNITLEEIDRLVPTIKTDSFGNFKPQLAKSHKDCSLTIWDKPKHCSKKLDGVRCMMKFDKESNTIKTVSRGGGNYDASLQHILEDKDLIRFFKDYPDVILDGEIYVHGLPLNVISGLARLETFEEKCKVLEYWIFDIADAETDFSERLNFIVLKMEDYFEESKLIKVVEHKYLEGYLPIKKYHDKCVEEGFEGIVARNPNKPYEFGKRTSSWVKLKEYQDDEFKIVGISEGLRDEDMCFVMETSDGKTFNAKPMGSREVKYEYLKNKDYYMGLYGTVKYFSMGVNGVPTQPVFKSIRLKKD